MLYLIGEKEIRTNFNGDPIVNCNKKTEKNASFIEVNPILSATHGLGFPGRTSRTELPVSLYQTYSRRPCLEKKLQAKDERF